MDMTIEAAFELIFSKIREGRLLEELLRRGCEHDKHQIAEVVFDLHDKIKDIASTNHPNPSIGDEEAAERAWNDMRNAPHAATCWAPWKQGNPDLFFFARRFRDLTAERPTNG